MFELESDVFLQGVWADQSYIYASGEDPTPTDGMQKGRIYVWDVNPEFAHQTTLSVEEVICRPNPPQEPICTDVYSEQIYDVESTTYYIIACGYWTHYSIDQSGIWIWDKSNFQWIGRDYPGDIWGYLPNSFNGLSVYQDPINGDSAYVCGYERDRPFVVYNYSLPDLTYTSHAYFSGVPGAICVDETYFTVAANLPNTYEGLLADKSDWSTVTHFDTAHGESDTWIDGDYLYIGENLYEYGTWAPVTQLAGVSARAYSVFSYDNEILVGDLYDLSVYDKNSKTLFNTWAEINRPYDVYADTNYIYAVAANKLYIINQGTIPTPTPTPYDYKTPTPTPSVTPTSSTTPTVTPTPSATPTPSTTPTAVPTPSTTPTVVPTPSTTPTVTPTPSAPPSPSPSSTPTATPTPDYCVQPLMVSDIEDAWLAQTRSTQGNGFAWRFWHAEHPGDSSKDFGWILDSQNSFVDFNVNSSAPVLLHIYENSQPVNIWEGDYVTIEYDGEQTLNIYPPPLSGSIEFGNNAYYYVAIDGSTYTDRELCNPAKAVPTPLATATPSPSSTPTVTPTPPI